MLFEDDLQKRKKAKLRTLPPIPTSSWRPPSYFPRLNEAIFISHDTETHERDWDHGPGWSRGQASIVGHSLTAYWSNNESWTGYFPIGHMVEPEYNLDRDQVTRYMRDVLSTNIPKGYANGLYDVGNCTDDRIFVQGELHDIQFAEALLSEDEDVDLDALGERYLGHGKEINALYQWCADAYGGEPTSGQRGNIYRTSPRMAGPYAEQDSKMILPILRKQFPKLQHENLASLYRLECDLIVLLVRMRMIGTRIDVDYAESLYGELSRIIVEKKAELKHLTGVRIADSAPTGDIAKVFDIVGIPYRLTPKTKKASITDDDLKVIVHPIAALVREIRQHDKIRGTFVKNGLLESAVNGVIHAEFHPLRMTGESGKRGTRTGRFASSHPNLQNIPVRTELGARIRKAYLPDEGHACWTDLDFSQYEYRWLAHFAVGPGSDELRAKYNNDPDTDYHDATTQQIKLNSPSAFKRWIDEGLDAGKIRKRVKTANFGLMNAMGLDLLASELGISVKEAKPFMAVYHEANPYIRATIKAASDEAQRMGYVTTALARRRRFNKWEPRDNWDEEKQMYVKSPMLSYAHAIRTYGPQIQRAMTHIALNTKTQGSNADGVKKAMHVAYKTGVYDVIGVPKITVHDSFGHSQIDRSSAQEEAYKELKRIMETCLPMRVPVRVDVERGPNWGSTAKE